MNESTLKQQVSQEGTLKIGKSISQIKLQLKQVIENLRELEEVQQGVKDMPAPTLRRIMQHTDKLLKRLRRAPLEKSIKSIEKRRQKRMKKKLTSLENKIATVTEPKSTQKPEPILEDIAPTASNLQHHISRKPTQQQLRIRHDAERFLRTFDLLRELHLIRSQDVEATNDFAKQLNRLRAVWNSVLEESAMECNHERNIEQQWDEAFFGKTQNSTEWEQELKLSDFLTRRKTWDSYITTKRDVKSSSIPIGWVLPPKNANSLWASYKCT